MASRMTSSTQPGPSEERLVWLPLRSWSAPRLPPWQGTLRLPREGPKVGGGRIETMDSTTLEAPHVKNDEKR